MHRKFENEKLGGETNENAGKYEKNQKKKKSGSAGLEVSTQTDMGEIE